MGFFKLSKKQLENATKKPKVMTAYPQEKDTGRRFADGAFNWIVNRYRTLRNPWKKSDNSVWKLACYTLPEFIGILIFFGIFWLLINISNKNYGEIRTLHFLLIYVLFRMNTMIKQLGNLNKKF